MERGIPRAGAGVADLTAAETSATALTIDESGQPVNVAGHSVGYDADRRLWYCDLEFANPGAYMPFVRLALARYQPSSIAGVELSHVVLADFAQLTPDRSASLTLDPATPTTARLVVGGLAPQGPATSVIDVAVQARFPGSAPTSAGRLRRAPSSPSPRTARPRASPPRSCGRARSPSPPNPGPVSSGWWCESPR